jgi:hypothetical protein
MTSLVAHNRGLYRLLDAHAGDVSEADKTRVRQNLATDLARAEDAFATYRATPLAVDERAAGDKYCIGGQVDSKAGVRLRPRPKVHGEGGQFF